MIITVIESLLPQCMHVHLYNTDTHTCTTQLNNAVSGALDRLHYEKDPCVRYDSTRKVWIYLHRGRTEDDFGKPNHTFSPPLLL